MFSLSKLISLIVIIVFLVLVFLALAGCPCPVSSTPFDSGIWRDIDDDLCLENRHKMIKSLTRKHLKKTMTKGDIVKFLGPPDEVRTAQTFVYGRDRYGITDYWTYDLLPTEGCNDCWILRIGFDDKGFYRCYHVAGD